MGLRWIDDITRRTIKPLRSFRKIKKDIGGKNKDMYVKSYDEIIDNLDKGEKENKFNNIQLENQRSTLRYDKQNVFNYDTQLENQRNYPITIGNQKVLIKGKKLYTDENGNRIVLRDLPSHLQREIKRQRNLNRLKVSPNEWACRRCGKINFVNVNECQECKYHPIDGFAVIGLGNIPFYEPPIHK